MTDPLHNCPPVPMDERHALQARAARWNYMARVKDLQLVAMARELSALVKDLRRVCEVEP